MRRRYKTERAASAVNIARRARADDGGAFVAARRARRAMRVGGAPPGHYLLISFFAADYAAFDISPLRFFAIDAFDAATPLRYHY